MGLHSIIVRSSIEICSNRGSSLFAMLLLSIADNKEIGFNFSLEVLFPVKCLIENYM